MAVGSHAISGPIGIPGHQQQASRSGESYGSSPPVRLPTFSSPSQQPPGKRATISVSFSMLASEQEGMRRMGRRRSKGSPAMTSGDILTEEEGPVLSTSLFSTLSLDDFDLDALVELPASPPVTPPSEQCYNRISKQGRKTLRSARLPLEHILEFEALVMDHLRSRTPRQSVLVGQEHFFMLALQNPFRRSLLHSVCQYYSLASQTVDKAAGLTVVRATRQTAPFPAVRLSDYLAATFGHMLPY